jgi:hypothetical protein
LSNGRRNGIVNFLHDDFHCAWDLLEPRNDPRRSFEKPHEPRRHRRMGATIDQVVAQDSSSASILSPAFGTLLPDDIHRPLRFLQISIAVTVANAEYAGLLRSVATIYI